MRVVSSDNVCRGGTNRLSLSLIAVVRLPCVPMNSRALFLVASLVANVAFAAAFVLRPGLAPAAVREFFQTRAARETALASAEAKSERARSNSATALAKAAAASQGRLWSALQS